MRLLVLVLRRIAWMPPTLLGLTLIVFAVSHVIPADPARVMAGENATPAQVEAMRMQLGLDQPLPDAVRAVRHRHPVGQYRHQHLHPAPDRGGSVSRACRPRWS